MLFAIVLLSTSSMIMGITFEYSNEFIQAMELQSILPYLE